MIVTPSTDTLRKAFPDDEGIHEIGEIAPKLRERLDEFERTMKDAAIVTLARDWEGMPFAFVEGDERFDVLALTENGAVGYGGINQPEYFDTLDEYIADIERRHGEREASNFATCGGCGRKVDQRDERCGACGFPDGASMAQKAKTSNPVIAEAIRLLRHYAVDEADLSGFEIREADADENPWDANDPNFERCYVISSFFDLVGDDHDESEVITEGGVLVSSHADGVETANNRAQITGKRVGYAVHPFGDECLFDEDGHDPELLSTVEAAAKFFEDWRVKAVTGNEAAPEIRRLALGAWATVEFHNLDDENVRDDVAVITPQGEIVREHLTTTVAALLDADKRVA